MSSNHPDWDSSLNYSPDSQPVSYDPYTGQPIYGSQSGTRQPIGYDPNTGAPIYESQLDSRQPVSYDPYTGAPIYEEEPAGSSRKKAPLGVIIGAVVAAVAVVAAILCFVFLRSTPMEEVTSALDNSMDAIYSRNDGLALLSKLSDDGNITINLAADDLASLTEAAAGITGTYNELDGVDAGVSGTISGNKDGEMSMNLALNIMGFSTDVQCYMSSREIILSAPSMLSSNYGLSLENLEERLENSIFAPDSGSAYALSSYDYEQLLAAAESISGSSSQKTVSPEEFRDALISALQKDEDANPEFDVSKEEIEVGGEDVKCSVYSTTIDNDSMAAMVRVLAEVLDETMPELNDSMMEADVDMIGELEDLAYELEEYGPGKVRLELAVYKDNLVRIDASMKESGQSVTIDLGKDPATSDIMSVTVQDFEEVTMIYERTENSKDTYSAEIRVMVDGEEFEAPLFTVEMDKESGDFTLTYHDDWDGFELEGNWKADGTSIYLEPYSVYSMYAEERFSIYDFSLEISDKDSVEKPGGDYIDILDMDEADIEDLIDELSFAAPF